MNVSKEISWIIKGWFFRKNNTESFWAGYLSPDLCCMVAQERFPVLSTGSFWANLLHIFWMVRLLTRISSLSNSPRMRSAPQSRLFAAISLIKLIVSDESLGFLACAFDLRFQNKRKSSRCQRRSVSGWTRKRACFQVRTILARTTRRNRSLLR